MGLDLNKAAGTYFKADHLMDGPIRGPIDRIEEQEIKDNRSGKLDVKFVLFITGDPRGLPLNVTNKDTLINAFGSKEEQMIGKVVELQRGTVQHAGAYFGNPCVRVVVPQEEE